MKIEAYLRQKLEFALADLPDANLATLSRLQERHALKVPWENLGGSRELLNDWEHLSERFAEAKRGGLGFELNCGFAALLKELGFDFRFRLARLADSGQAFNHLTIEVDIEGKKYLADPGLQGALFHPVPIDESLETRILGENYRFVTQDGALQLERYERQNGGYVPLLVIADEATDADIAAIACELTAAQYWEVEVCAAAIPDGRVTLRGDQLISVRNGIVRSETLASEAQVESNKRRFFGLKP